MNPARKIIPITEDQHFADYAELQKPPEPHYEINSTKLFWIGLTILLGCAIWALVIVEGLRL